MKGLDAFRKAAQAAGALEVRVVASGVERSIGLLEDARKHSEGAQAALERERERAESEEAERVARERSEQEARLVAEIEHRAQEREREAQRETRETLAEIRDQLARLNEAQAEIARLLSSPVVPEYDERGRMVSARRQVS